jgi:hypothetical protein
METLPEKDARMMPDNVILLSTTKLNQELLEMKDTMEKMMKKFNYSFGMVESLDNKYVKQPLIDALDKAEHYQMEALCATMRVMEVMNTLYN